jgi:hypothetical protein
MNEYYGGSACRWTKDGGEDIFVCAWRWAPMDSPFMQRVAEGVAASGVRVIRFEFPYMQRRRGTGKRGAPDPPRVLMQSFRDAIEKAGGSSGLVIGGKSMGGRIASMVADDAGVLGLVCLGYPFHPPGKLEKTRTSHLENLRTPNPPGNARQLWQPGRRPRLQAIARDSNRVARRRRSLLQAARTQRPHRGRQRPRGYRARR